MVGRAALLAVIAMLTLAPAHARAGDGAEPGPTGLTTQTRKMGGQLPREQRALELRHLDLRMKIEPSQRRIEGDATLTMRSTETLATLVVDLYPGYRISLVSIDGQTLAPTAYQNPEGQLRIRLPRTIAPGEEFNARIVYAGPPHVARRPPWEGGVVWGQAPGGQPWISSAVWGAGCDLLWPCIDHPTRKPASADLHYTVPAPLAAPAGGKFLGMEEKDGWRTFHWRVRSPHTYGVVLNVGPFEVLEADHKSRFGNTIPMRYWHLPDEDAAARELFAEFSQILDFFEATIGPYPWADQKMGVVETSFLGMEHQTINAYGNKYAKSQYGFDWLLQHEFSHEYFANQVAAANYDDLWLHESFATYMQPLYAQYRNGDGDYFAYLASQRAEILNERPLVTGAERTEEEVYASPDGPRYDIYVKGSLVLHTLRMLIGDEAFFRSIRRLVYGRPDPAPGNFAPRFATTPDFIRIVNEEAGRDLSWFFNVYLYQAALPELIAERTDDDLRLRWNVPNGLPFPMPVDVRMDGRIVTASMSNGAEVVRAPRHASVTIDPHNKILRRSEAIERFRAWGSAQARRDR
jgi:aminopeptidase N